MAIFVCLFVCCLYGYDPFGHYDPALFSPVLNLSGVPNLSFTSLNSPRPSSTVPFLKDFLHFTGFPLIIRSHL